jgi:hypothetical protein
MIAAVNSWVLSFDNLSCIAPWFSDALCRLSTGGGFAVRQLHTDSEEILFDATRPIILNGIEDLARNADLRDRSIILTLPSIEADRRSEMLYWKDFCLARPGIIGGLLDALSMALRNLAHVNVPQLTRMADFERLVSAAAPSLPFDQDEFLQAYADNRQESVSFSLESSPLAEPIQNLVDAGDWEGTATQLLQKLSEMVPPEVRKKRAWPKDPRTLSCRVRRLAPLLRQSGLDVSFGVEGHLRTKLIKLAKKVSQTSDRSDRAADSSHGCNGLPAGAESSSRTPSSDRRKRSATARTAEPRSQAQGG